MSVESPSDEPPPLRFAKLRHASRAQLADYLEAQADDLEALATVQPGDPHLIGELAARFATIAREHGLTFVAERFDRLVPPGAQSGTGTHGA